MRYKAVGRAEDADALPELRADRLAAHPWTGGDPTALGPRPSVAPLVLKILLITVLIPLLLIGVIAGLLIAVL